MEELERVKRKIKSAGELQSVVKIMKAISSTNIREYERAVESLAEYSRSIEMGLSVVMMKSGKIVPAFSPAREGGLLGAVIFGSDQGLCGKFNEQIASFALGILAEMENEETRAVAVGERVIGHLEDGGLSIEAQFSFSGDFLGITEVMGEVLVKIEEWRIEGGLDRIVLFYNRPESGPMAIFRPSMARLLPLDERWMNELTKRRWPSRSLPTFSMDPDWLFSSLVREHIFSSLYRAFVESLASENASRLSSMQAAERNIEEHLNELSSQYRKRRQEAISSEMQDVLVGFEALMGERRG
ncbi:F0F1 ATP synthase subunit gamma [Methanotrichaceae archaeon M04Ac]|jgi:F-type H+-transporting ATPase subunit gamma|uniref:F0F1 ATP synthase subunit gamma n=1 Tax=Candidatus Methanocrinis alkalitolerans TaxID=3033395 RepID=A0ABT5XHN2_9EURY|nr:F0F1 ATP synthase subunit gamma [Candidatus Methanocrinis alkalitolerans]MCR3883785.1 F0F1 ATP synthase subunit gamma [Methanothrix sp.]MDF0594141.1 F0F1 ATP synthase subunit gamma [Candidatus Methanocrinis alkalitolerans]